MSIPRCLLYMYNERANTRRACKSRIDRHHGVLVLFRKPPRFQDANAQPLLLRTAELESTSPLIHNTAPLVVLYILFGRPEASFCILSKVFGLRRPSVMVLESW